MYSCLLNSIPNSQRKMPFDSIAQWNKVLSISLFPNSEQDQTPTGNALQPLAAQKSKGIRISKKYIGKEVYSNNIPPGRCFGLSHFWLLNRKKAYDALSSVSHEDAKDTGHKIKLQYIEDSCDFNRSRNVSSPFWREVCQAQGEEFRVHMRNNFHMKDLGQASYVLLSKSKKEFPIAACAIFLIMNASNQEICWDFILVGDHAVAAEFKINKKDKTFDITFFEVNSQIFMHSQVIKASIPLSKLEKYKGLCLLKEIQEDETGSFAQMPGGSIQNDLEGFLDRTHFFSKTYSTRNPAQTIMDHRLYFENKSNVPNKLELIRMYGSISKLTLDEKNDLLFISSVSGYANVVLELLSSDKSSTRADINYKSLLHGTTPVWQSAGVGHAEIVRILLEAGADANLADEDGVTPLTVAAQNGHFEVVKILLKAGADVNLASKHGVSPLLLAAQNGHTDIVKILLEAHAHVDSIFKTYGSTPLLQAIRFGHTAILKMLLQRGADIYHSDKNGMIPLDIARQYNRSEIEQILLDHMHKVDAEMSTEDRKYKLLIRAAKKGKIDTLESLLTSVDDINKEYEDGNHLLMYSVKNSHADAVGFLLTHCADKNKEDKRGKTPLYHAAKKGDTKIVEMLIAYGADTNKADKKGRTPLQRAMKKGNNKVVELLLAHGADVNTSTNTGCTALLFAAQNGCDEIVEMLLAHGADVNKAHVSGCTPLRQAAQNGHIGIVRKLLEYGADASLVDSNGWTPLRVAQEHGHDEIVKLLSMQIKS